jgi:hypothetical protein
MSVGVRTKFFRSKVLGIFPAGAWVASEVGGGVVAFVSLGEEGTEVADDGDAPSWPPEHAGRVPAITQMPVTIVARPSRFPRMTAC